MTKRIAHGRASTSLLYLVRRRTTRAEMVINPIALATGAEPARILHLPKRRIGRRGGDLRVLAPPPAKPERPVARWVALACGLLSIIAYLAVVRLGGVLLYLDGISHLEITRRVTDGTSRGLAQLGGVWLPLPHLLMLPFVWITPLYQDGFAGSIGSMTAYVVTAVLVYKIVVQLTDQKVAAGMVGAGVFALNVNMLYMQATPMTESLLFALMAAAVYFVQQWAFTGRYRYLSYGAVAALFATLTRYEAWAIVAGLAPVVCLVAWRQQRRMLPGELHWRRVADRVIVVFGLPASAGVFAWVVWNWVIFGSPFYFQFGPFSRPALWTPSTDPAVHHWGVAAATYWYAMQDILGRPTLLLSVIGVGLMLVVQWRKGEFVNALPALSLLIMVPFFVVMLYTGQRPMHVTQVSPRLSLYNVRFALIMLTPVAISIGYLAGSIEGYWTGVGVRWSAPVVAGVMLVGVAGIAAWSLMNHDVPTYNEPRSWQSLPTTRDQHAVVDYLNAHYDGRQELLMESNGNEIIAFYEPANELIYEGTYQRWGQALHDPTGHNIRWIVARCGGSPDLVCTTDGRHQLSNYNRVFMTSDGVYRVYEIK